MSKYYAAGGDGDGYELAVANNLWGQQGFPWKADFLERQRTRFGAELTQMDFIDPENRETARKTINASIEKATRDKIKELLRNEPTPDLTSFTRIVLTNAIYFKGDWAEQFDKKRTADAPFTLADGSKKTMPMMNRKGELRYMETETFQAVELPYKGGELAMVVLLPRKHDGLTELEKELNAENLKKWIKNMDGVEVELYLPKFKTEQRFDLAEILDTMGMSLAFTPKQADFFGMVNLDAASWRIWISKVIHQSFIVVNEEGTEAAAATAVLVSEKPVGMPAEAKRFLADHPFVYLIRDTKTGNILFLGRYTGP